jgi:anti-sigma B factor antagonist
MFEIRNLGEGRLELVGRLDAAAADSAAAAFRSFEGSLTLDCSELDYISSAGLGLIIELYQRLYAAGGTLTLTRLVPRVYNVFTYAGFDRLLRIERLS